MSENQQLLDAIRVIVGEAVAPLAERMDGFDVKLDGLTERVDGLTERVDGLTERMGRVEAEQIFQRGLLQNMEQRFAQIDERFAQIDGRFAQIDERFVQIDGRFAQIDERFAQIDERFAQIDGRFVQIDARFDQADLRLTNLEGMCMRLENEIGTVETRTGQISSDIADLLELQNKVNEGFRAFKSDFQRAFIDIGAIQEAQTGYQRDMKQLRARVDLLERRLAKLEGSEGAR